MKIVLSGGGTGGHIYPALALREYILTQYPDAEFLYIGSEKGLEKNIVTQRGIPFESVEVQGFKRSLSLGNVKTVWKALTSVQKAKKILKQFKPDVIIGTGGYVCGPVLYAGAKLGIRTMIHEQNSVAGVTNKILSKYVDHICTCFEAVHADFQSYKHKIVLTGNPRGQELLETPENPTILEQFGLKTGIPTVLIFGGSRGAANLNEAFVRLYPMFKEETYQILMVTGQVHYESMKERIGETVSHIKVVPYIDQMIDVLKQVDLVVCRSGATTLAELTALGVASVLIPSPYVTNNHQEKNAQALVQKNAAKMILESELKTQALYDVVHEVMSDEKIRIEMGQQAKNLGITDASKRLFDIVKMSHKA